MDILKGRVLKAFGALVLVSMIGAVFAMPVALGDVGWYLGHKLGYKAGTYVGEKLSDNEYVIKGAGHIGSYLGGRIGWRAGMTIGAEIGALAGPEGAIIGAAVGAI